MVCKASWAKPFSGQICEVPGGLSGIALLLRQLTNEGDGVLIHTPAYHQFSNLVNKAGREVVKSSLVNDGQSYQIDFEEMEQVVEIAKRHDVLSISDEIHLDIILKATLSRA